MAELAGHDDPRVRSTGRIAAQYFRGRLDARSATGEGFQPAVDRRDLLVRCGELLRARGHDLRSLDDALAPPAAPDA